jgi:hypothetical protein
MATTRQVLAYIKQSDKDAKDGGRRRLTAPKGKFRVIGVDTFEGPRADYLIDDFKSLHAAIASARSHAGNMNPCYVYDDEGSSMWSGGSV